MEDREPDGVRLIYDGINSLVIVWAVLVLLVLGYGFIMVLGSMAAPQKPEPEPPTKKDIANQERHGR